jgi:NDP-sugar pyrophosphorylase family protein
MQVVILAGGLGTRLWPLTSHVPKPLVPVAGVPYLEHQLGLLARQSLTDIVVLTGYLGEQIEECFGDGRRLGVRIRYLRERQPLGTGGALREARPLLAESFLVIYGDSYLPIEYAAVGRLLMATAASAVMAVYRDRSRETNVPPNVALDADGTVLRYDKKAPPDDCELQCVEAGVLALRRTVLDLMPQTGTVSLEEHVFPILIERRRLLGFSTRQRFYDMGTPERLKAIEEYLA